MGREDPHSLSGRELPAEQNKMKASKTNTSVREAHFLPHTGLPIFKQAQREMESLLQSTKWKLRADGENSYFPETAANIFDFTKEQVFHFIPASQS